MLLLHGFGQSKSTMLMIAQYFRSLGFHVISADLSGHGDSTSPRGMGVSDATDLARFLESETFINAFPRPLFIAGHSMGALAALHMAKKLSVSPDGLVLLAPMQQIDKAAVVLAQLSSRWYAGLIDENVIAEGVKRTLHEKNIAPEQTDSLIQLKKVLIPTLVFASDKDPIAPYSQLKGVTNPSVSVYQVKDTPHELMLWLENWQHERLVDFFLNLTTQKP